MQPAFSYLLMCEQGVTDFVARTLASFALEECYTVLGLLEEIQFRANLNPVPTYFPRK
jgi:hypothetical protein